MKSIKTKYIKKILTLTLALIMVLGMAPLSTASAAGGFGGAYGFGAMPSGTYTYVSKEPSSEPGSTTGQVQFIYQETNNLVWALGSDSGVETLSGDELEFFKGLYLADLPVTDWFGGDLKDIEGYAGDVGGNVDITITDDAKISEIKVTSATALAVAVVTEDITAATLTVSGATRGQPRLLQSCITLVGSTNGLYLTRQGDVVLDGVRIGQNADGVGLQSDKIGGDTFIVGTVAVDGRVEWHNKMGVILPLNSRPGTLVTNGQDITITGGSNVGRVGRNLTISTGEGLGGNITIGATVSTDSTRGGLLPNANTSADGITINTSGNIIAGLGDVIIGTNEEKIVTIDLIGNIQGANVTIKPNKKGSPANVTASIGNITATESIDIVVGTVNSRISETTVNDTNNWTSWSGGGEDGKVIGNLTAENGDITLTAGLVYGDIGTISVPNGTEKVSIQTPETYTVSFQSNGGTEIPSQTVKYGRGVTEPDDPTRELYAFTGWYKDAACDTAWNFNTDGVTENTTLYAGWTKDSWLETVKDVELPFTDVEDGAWAINFIKYVYANGLMAGTSSTTFSPGTELTRAQLVQILYNLEGGPEITGTTPFTDVPAGEWYASAITWAYEKGVIAGTSETTASPLLECDRQTTATMLYNYARYKGYDITAQADLSARSDQDSIASWARTQMSWANAIGMINGTSATTLSPLTIAYRDQIAAMITNFVEYYQ